MAESKEKTDESILEVSSRLNSTTSSLQSYRAELINESLEQSRLLSGEEYSDKTALLLEHLRSQNSLSLKAIEEVYHRQVRRNKTSDKMLMTMERLVTNFFGHFS